MLPCEPHYIFLMTTSISVSMVLCNIKNTGYISNAISYKFIILQTPWVEHFRVSLLY